MQWACWTALCDQPSPSLVPWRTKFQFLPVSSFRQDKTLGRQNCADCGSLCSGHYVINIASLLELRQQGKAIWSAPPSTIIKEAFKDGTADDNIQQLAKRCYLKTEEVQLWLAHLNNVKLARARAAKRATETRSLNRTRAKGLDVWHIFLFRCYLQENVRNQPSRTQLKTFV